MSRIPLFYRSKLNILAAVFLLSFVISAFVGMQNAYDPSLSWPVLLAILFSGSLYVIIVLSNVSPWKISRGLVVVASVVAFYFVTQYNHFNYPWEQGYVSRLGRMTSSVIPNLVMFVPHPNAIASFLEGVFLVSVVIVWHSSSRVRWVWIMLTVIIAYGLLISDSRGAWLGIAIALGIYGFLNFSDHIQRLAVIGLGIVGGVMIGAFIIFQWAAPGQSIFLISSTLSRVDSRLALYQSTLRLMGDYPFVGIGLGDTFAMVYSRYQLLIHVPYLYYAHNLFLSVGLGQGLFGLVALIGLLILFYYFVIRVERIGIGSIAQVTLFRAAWLGVTASLIHGLTDSTQFSDAVWTMPVLFALAAIVVVIGRKALMLVGRINMTAQTRYIGWAIVGVIIVVVLIGTVIFWRPLVGAWYANLGSIYQTKADLSPSLDETSRELLTTHAIRNFEQALKIDPDQSTANRRLGLIALEQQDFDAAVTYLERAYTRDPNDLGTLKILGYAYLWTGQLDAAEQLFRQVDFNGNLANEMDYWQWWWGTQNQENLSSYAQEMAQRLKRG